MDKTKQWGLATAAAILAIAVGGWFLLISPQRSEASDLRTQADAQTQSNLQLQNRIAALQAQHKDLPQVQAELAKLATQLPSNPALPALIRQLSNAADSAGVGLVSLSPSEPQLAVAPTAAAPATDTATDTTTATDTSAAAASTPVAAPASQLAYVPITVVVNGGYFNVEQFVSNLEANKRVFLVTEIDAVPQKPKTAASDTAPTSAGNEYDGHLQATITGRVFMNASTPDAAPSSAATAAAK